MRILEGVKEKVENKGQYKAYLEELSPVIKELGELVFQFMITVARERGRGACQRE